MKGRRGKRAHRLSWRSVNRVLLKARQQKTAEPNGLKILLVTTGTKHGGNRKRHRGDRYKHEGKHRKGGAPSDVTREQEVYRKRQAFVSSGAGCEF